MSQGNRQRAQEKHHAERTIEATTRREGICTHEHEGGGGRDTYFVDVMSLPEKFYRTMTARLARIALNLGVPPDQIADVLQEVWLDFAIHREGFGGQGAVERLCSWLDTVVRSKSKNVIRHLRRRREVSLEGLPREPVDRKAKLPEEVMEVKERVEQLAVGLDKLRKESPLNHYLLCERILNGRSPQDLAAETGLSAHAISCRISRIRKEFGNRLKQ